MENFLKDYVKMVAEVKEIELDKKELKEIVDNLMEEEEIWDLLDQYVNMYLDGDEEED